MRDEIRRDDTSGHTNVYRLLKPSVSDAVQIRDTGFLVPTKEEKLVIPCRNIIAADNCLCLKQYRLGDEPERY